MWQVVIIQAGTELLVSPPMAASHPLPHRQPAVLVDPSAELGHPWQMGEFGFTQIHSADEFAVPRAGSWTPSPPNMRASGRIWKVLAAAPREHHGSSPGLLGDVKDLRRAVLGSP